jgi:hypothetical protein
MYAAGRTNPNNLKNSHEVPALPHFCCSLDRSGFRDDQTWCFKKVTKSMTYLSTVTLFIEKNDKSQSTGTITKTSASEVRKGPRYTRMGTEYTAGRCITYNHGGSIKQVAGACY